MRSELAYLQLAEVGQTKRMSDVVPRPSSSQHARSWGYFAVEHARGSTCWWDLERRLLAAYQKWALMSTVNQEPKRVLSRLAKVWHTGLPNNWTDISWMGHVIMCLKLTQFFLQIKWLPFWTVSLLLTSGLKLNRGGNGRPFGKRAFGSRSSSKKECAHASSCIQETKHVRTFWTQQVGTLNIMLFSTYSNSINRDPLFRWTTNCSQTHVTTQCATH
jgi:hypothetical protein